ncbi:MAG: DUF4328 domain-containing protein, partial [Pseudonocardia sp.]|nr:DUF4328 domain-containing protein [Pseudonocardia sp.]
PPGRRPRPSQLLLVWWALWAAGVMLAGIVLLWSMRPGVQARADGVVLHAALDLLAAGTAGVTAVLLARLTRLLAPARTDRREILVRVTEPASAHPDGAPEPARAGQPVVAGGQVAAG